jgi:hypothetical protein
LNKAISSLDSAKTLAEYSPLSVRFYRLWETNPNDKLPAYCYIYSSLLCAEDSVYGNRSEILKKTHAFVENHCKKFMVLSEFNILKARLCLLQYKNDKDSTSLSKCSFLLKKVLKLDQNNIRAQYLLAQYYLIKYPDSEYGKQQAGKWINGALENCNIKPNNKFPPIAWGKSEVEEMALMLNLQEY